MIMTTTSDVEQQRLRYASELAEYTRRQWDMARQSLEHTSSQPQEKNGCSGSTSSSPLKDISCASQGIQSHDYARRSHRRGGNIAHESRSIAA
ncbi:hypothetical protein BDY19DRAFT_29115 [Irpex rosettiformis]|uniref:Uncharacterized protein n=1 Tax=Irpex rosettiformis TaxID=378272 RepID=A0ACB8UJR9_9APHY|nr:hypothetical protein BDY19DRAFT_29115 [Irpex rosettiformis]